METTEEKLLRLEFYQNLLLSIADPSHPFYAMIIKNQLSQKEVEEIYQLCNEITITYEQQKEEGFVTFTPLLNHFVGMLNYKLDPHKTIEALYSQNIYRQLMSLLKNEINKC